MKPYFFLTFFLMVSNSVLDARRATASIGEEPSFTRPRASQGCTLTLEVCASRFAFPDPELVQNPTFEPSTGTTHTGVAIGV